MLKKTDRSLLKRFFFFKRFGKLTYRFKYYINLKTNVLAYLKNNHIYLYNGKQFVKLIILRWKVGLLLGLFCVTRKNNFYSKK